MLYGVLSQAATKVKNSSMSKDALQSMWSALPEKAIHNAMKDYNRQLQACVSVNGRHFEHIM